MDFWWIALTLGFLGSFHCVGMCGPIALAIPIKRRSPVNVISGSMLYNFGRVITYSSMGFLFGLFGKGVVLAGMQNILSIVLGVMILVLFFLPKLNLFSFTKGPVFVLLGKLKAKIRKLFGEHKMRSLLFIGVLNGFLPCGLVYLGITGSVATGDAIKGAAFMAVFGFGTFPAMIAVSMLKNYIGAPFRENIRKIIPVFVAAMAVLLILRGMNLGIPYISPSVEITNGVTHHQCCHK